VPAGWTLGIVAVVESSLFSTVVPLVYVGAGKGAGIFFSFSLFSLAVFIWAGLKAIFLSLSYTLL